jgi:hypothetical protein
VIANGERYWLGLIGLCASSICFFAVSKAGKYHDLQAFVTGISLCLAAWAVYSVWLMVSWYVHLVLEAEKIRRSQPLDEPLS